MQNLNNIFMIPSYISEFVENLSKMFAYIFWFFSNTCFIECTWENVGKQ